MASKSGLDPASRAVWPGQASSQHSHISGTRRRKASSLPPPGVSPAQTRFPASAYGRGAGPPDGEEPDDPARCQSRDDVAPQKARSQSPWPGPLCPPHLPADPRASSLLGLSPFITSPRQPRSAPGRGGTPPLSLSGGPRSQRNPGPPEPGDLTASGTGLSAPEPLAAKHPLGPLQAVSKHARPTSGFAESTFRRRRLLNPWSHCPLS